MNNLYSPSEMEHTFMPSKPITNADKVRTMTDEELAKFMNYGSCPPGEDVIEICNAENVKPAPNICDRCWLEWLKQEVR